MPPKYIFDLSINGGPLLDIASFTLPGFSDADIPAEVPEVEASRIIRSFNGPVFSCDVEFEPESLEKLKKVIPVTSETAEFSHSVQFRFPRRKGRRIRKKWMKNQSNWRKLVFSAEIVKIASKKIADSITNWQLSLLFPERLGRNIAAANSRNCVCSIGPCEHVDPVKEAQNAN